MGLAYAGWALKSSKMQDPDRDKHNTHAKFRFVTIKRLAAEVNRLDTWYDAVLNDIEMCKNSVQVLPLRYLFNETYAAISLQYRSTCSAGYLFGSNGIRLQKEIWV